MNNDQRMIIVWEAIYRALGMIAAAIKKAYLDDTVFSRKETTPL